MWWMVLTIPTIRSIVMTILAAATMLIPKTWQPSRLVRSRKN